MLRFRPGWRIGRPSFGWPALGALGPPRAAVPVLWALISALWIGISSAAPELIWQGLKIALAHPTWADLVSAVLIGLILAFFIEPVIERARELLRRGSWSHAFDGRSHHALFAASLSFAFAVISVGLHDAMLAIISDKGFEYNGNSGLTAGLALTAEWAFVPVAITLAWHAAGDRLLAVPLGILAAASPVIAMWPFGWPIATVITTAVPCLAILGLGYVQMGREPRQEAFARTALRLLIVAAIWLPIARLIDVATAQNGQFYGWSDVLVDARFYIGWAVGLALVPVPVDSQSRAERMAP
jgi:hypothetical protein